jgi:endoglucanase
MRTLAMSVFLSLVVAAGATILPRLAYTKESGATQTIKFEGLRGIGGFRSFNGTRDPSRPDRYDADPFAPRWRYLMTREKLAEIRGAGFDFLRIGFDPGPLFEADEERKRFLLDDIREAIDVTLAADLKVLLDVHVNFNHPKWNHRAVTAGFETLGFQRYIETVRDVAKLVAKYDPARVAYEPFNEPPHPCKWNDRPDWNEQLSMIVREIRRFAPHHTLVVTGACMASFEGLVQVDASRLDANTVFTFHYYGPEIFAHQGFWSSSKHLEYVPRLAYPPNVSERDEIISRVTNRIMTAAAIPEKDRGRQANAARTALLKYFSEPLAPASIQQDFAKVKRWADQYKIEPKRIMLGEFGAMKDVFGKTGAAPDDRARWFRDVRTTAETFGFRWSAWAYSNSYGIIVGDRDGSLDPQVLEALGLRPSGRTSGGAGRQ